MLPIRSPAEVRLTSQPQHIEICNGYDPEPGVKHLSQAGWTDSGALTSTVAGAVSHTTAADNATSGQADHW